MEVVNGVTYLRDDGRLLELTEEQVSLLDVNTVPSMWHNTTKDMIQFNGNNGIIDIGGSGLIVEDPTGIVDADRGKIKIDYDNVARSLTVRPYTENGYPSFRILDEGTLHVISTPQTVTVPNSYAVYALYYNVVSDVPVLTIADYDGLSDAQKEDLFKEYIILYFAIYDDAEAAWTSIMTELHGSNMPYTLHKYLHDHFHAVYGYGLKILDFASGDGSSENDCSIGIEAGMFSDEDIPFHTPQIAKSIFAPAPLSIENGKWKRYPDTISWGIAGFGGRPLYNDVSTAGSESMVEMASEKFGYYILYATNDMFNTFNYVIGQGEYNYYQEALNAGIDHYIANPRVSAMFKESLALAVIVFKASDAFTNSKKTNFIIYADLKDKLSVAAETLKQPIITDSQMSLSSYRMTGSSYYNVDTDSYIFWNGVAWQEFQSVSLWSEIYREDWETGTLASLGWAVKQAADTTLDLHWQIGTSEKVVGTRSLYVSRANNVNLTNPASYLGNAANRVIHISRDFTMPTDVSGRQVNKLRLKFYWRCLGQSIYDYAIFHIVTTGYTLTANIAIAANGTDRIAIGDGYYNEQYNWQLSTIELPAQFNGAALIGQTVKIVISFIANASVIYNPPMCIDLLKLEFI